MVSRSAVRTIVGIIGSVISFGLFASPSPTIWRIFKNKAVEEFKPDPYIATVINCLFWVLYGLPWNHPDSILVLTINGIGLVVELAYLFVFFLYGHKKTKRKIAIFVLIEFLCCIVTGGLVYKFCPTFAKREEVIGIICVIFGTLMYASPLTIMHTVMKTKSVEHMPFFLSFVSFLNGLCWSTYALLKFDLFILCSNSLGVLLAAIQLILYACFYKTTPKKEVKALTSQSSLQSLHID